MPRTIPLRVTPLGECPYLPDRQWTLAVGAPPDLTGDEFDWCLRNGFRRMGRMVYLPHCQGCQACISLRIPVAQFAFSKSQRRVLRKNRDVELEIGTPEFSDDRLALYRKFLQHRYPDKEPPTMTDYVSFFVSQLGFTSEFRYRIGQRLVGLGIVDGTPQSASSVYFYFDPEEAWRSLGVYSLLQEITWCRETGRQHVYLGFYIEACKAMRYKAQYRPHEQRQPDGRWLMFE